MLSMQEKALVGIVVVFVAIIAASVVIPVRTFEVKLVTSPAEGVAHVPAGKPFSVTCQGLSEHDGKFTFMRWLDKDGKAIPEGGPEVKKDGKNSIKLVFTNPNVGQSGVYLCSARYDAKHVLEKKIEIIFYGSKPTFDNYFENLSAKEGSRLEVGCSAFGDMPITYEWYQDEEKVSENSSSPIFVLNSENNSTLIIKKIVKSHESMYSCLARNDHGLSSKVHQLTVLPSSEEESDDNIKNVEARNITSTSVRFFIVVSGSAKSIEAKFRKTGSDAERRMSWNIGDNYEVKDLSPGVAYMFYFRTLPAEKEEWSKVYTVTLLPVKPEIILRNIQDGTVNLEWFVSTDDRMRGTIDSYELKYYTLQMDRGNTFVPSSCATIIQRPSCAGNSYIIAGLATKVYYEIQIRAHTVSGYGEADKQKFYLT